MQAGTGKEKPAEPAALATWLTHAAMPEALMQYVFHLGQLVRVARSSSGLMDGRIYCVVSLLPSEGDPVYRIKNMSGIERLVKPDEIEPAAVTAVP